jgi:UBX domain-containing protein 1
LEANRWDISNAATEFFTFQEEGGVEAQEGADEVDEVPQVPEGYTGPRTLDGRPAPTSSIPTGGSSSRRPARQAPRSGFATLDSLNQGSTGGHAGHGHDDDDDSDDEDYMDGEQPRDLFAGGEKSGLAVQDPRRNDPRSLVKDIIKKAQA